MTTPATPISVFLALEASARAAATPEVLRAVMVNEPRRLVPYRSAALFDLTGGSPRVVALSDVPVPDKDAPLVQWLAAKATATRLLGPSQPILNNSTCFPPAVHSFMLSARDGRPVAALWLARDEPWQPHEITLLERLADCYGHALTALVRPRRLCSRRARRIKLAVAITALASLALPVSQTTLAPATISPASPIVIAAPIDGVIADFAVRPNQPVAAGDPLFQFDATTLRAQAETADRALAVAQADLHTAQQGAISSDRKAGAAVAQADATVALRTAEAAYAHDLLSRTAVAAPTPGVAIFTDENDWRGRPVVTGQRILTLADPARIEVTIEVPVRDAIALSPGAPVALYLDTAPLSPLAATLVSASYEAELTPAGTLAYRARAALASSPTLTRIGLQGTAKLTGGTVPLALYLFRRPLAAVRQALGI